MNGIRYVRPGNDFQTNITFFRKIEVNGANDHPLYSYLKVSDGFIFVLRITRRRYTERRILIIFDYLFIYFTEITEKLPDDSWFLRTNRQTNLQSIAQQRCPLEFWKVSHRSQGKTCETLRCQYSSLRYARWHWIPSFPLCRICLWIVIFFFF